MEPAWLPQGRGRGRNHSQVERSRPQRMAAGRPGSGVERGGSSTKMAVPSEGVAVHTKFEEIRKSDQAAAQRLMNSRLSSSSSDDDDDEDAEADHKDAKRGQILESTFTTYTDQTGGDATGLLRTGQYVSELFQSGALTCLICIASVKRTQAGVPNATGIRSSHPEREKL